MIIIDNDKVPEYAATLQNLTKPVAERISALWCLRTVGTMEAVEACCVAFDLEPKSDLLKHEICYVLGQMDKTPEMLKKSQAFLEHIVTGEHSKVVYHEAFEALGNLNQETTWELFKKFDNDESTLILETNYLAKKLMQWKTATENGKTEGIDKMKLKFTTNDPAPIWNFEAEPKYADVKFLESILLDNKNYDLFDRYRAIFTLRELFTEESASALAASMKKENFANCSPLLKHEVCFVLGQMEGVFGPAIPIVLECMNDPEEHPIVLHEGLVCLGDMLEPKDKPLIEKFL